MTIEKFESAITVWTDESTGILIRGVEYNMIGHLIANSDKEEFDFLNKLRQSRKEIPSCWTNLHGCKIKESDTRKLDLLERWLIQFKNSEHVYFHIFLYRKNERYITQEKTYEHYFAKQSVFSLANKMKKRGYLINTMFKDVSTLTILFDRRRSHFADIVFKDSNQGLQIRRLNDLEKIYKKEIEDQISRISSRNTKTTDLTIRFSFLSSECFDAMQLCDCLLYLVRKKIEQEAGATEDPFTKLFDKYFLDNLGNDTKLLSFKEIYQYDKKFNFFESNR